jgi:DNA-binding CsgD family transcriptional regulator
MVINNISLHISIQAGFGFTILMLGAAWFLTLRMTPDVQEKKIAAREFDTKTGLKALFLLFLFITIISVDFGIMIETVNPKYDSFGWLTSWYWILPYSGAALIMKCQKDTNNRGNILYIAVGMIGSGFILFLLLDHAVTSYLIVNTVMMGAWAVSDVFWYSILGEMLDLIKGSAKIFSVGFSAVMLGVLLGKLLADNDTTVSGSNLPIVTMAVICLTLIILPVLHRLLSAMIKKNEPAQINFPDGEDAGSPISRETLWGDDAGSPTIALAMDDYRGSDGRSRETFWGEDTLTEREKQIAALLLKGRTCKLIAAELYLSENTVKTHIKNIYSKLGIKSKSELFNIGGKAGFPD